MNRECAWCEAERASSHSRGTPGPQAESDPVCWFHRLRVLLTSPWRVGVRFLVVVPRSEPKLFAWASEKFLEEPRVQVLVDRRRVGPWVPAEASEEHRGERRSPIAPWNDGRFDAVRIVPTWPKEDARIALERSGRVEDIILQSRSRFDRWVRDGERILHGVLPQLFERYGALERRSIAADEAWEALRRRRQDLADEVARLRSSISQHREERAAIAEITRAVSAEVERFVQLMQTRVTDPGAAVSRTP